MIFRFVALAFFVSAGLQARVYNYNDILLGERNFGMGGASVALKSDTSAMYYNPAVLAENEFDQVSASGSVYTRMDSRTGTNVSAFQSARDNVSRGGFLSIPTVTGGHVKKGEVSWGGTVIVPESYKTSGVNELSDTASASFEGTHNSIWLGAFAAKKFSENHWFGASLFYVNRSISEKFFTMTNISDMSNANVRYVEHSLVNNGIAAVLGGVWKFSENWKFGYSILPPILSLKGSGFYADVTSGKVTENKNRQNFSNSSRFPLPMRASVGLARESEFSPWAFAADVHFYSAVNRNFGPSNTEAFHYDMKEILNYAVGGEYTGEMPVAREFFKNIGFRFGIYSNFSSARRIDESHISAINDKVHMFGATGAIAFIKPTGSISIGGYAQGGQGTAVKLTEDFGSGGDAFRSNFMYAAVIASSVHF